MNDTPDQKPWFRQFWPWFLVFFPLCAVVAGVATIIIASHKPDTVVVDDYYKKGLAINLDIARTKKAEQLGLQARLNFTPDQGRVSLVLSSKGALGSKFLLLRLFHPTLSKFDQTIKLEASAAGVFSGKLAGFQQGKWILTLEPADRSWSLTKKVEVKAGADILMGG